MRDLFGTPIFILAPPRSGSTFLFNCLCRFDKLYHLEIESDDIWWRVFPYERTSSPSDYVGLADATGKNIKKFKNQYYNKLIIQKGKKNFRTNFPFLRPKIQFIDKTIANCFHLEFLRVAFPDAKYIFLVRDPRANISSMIEGWSAKGFHKPQLKPFIDSHPDSKISKWNYPAPPGWQTVINLPINQICAWIWEQHITSVVDFSKKNNLPLIMVKYEDLIGNLEGEIKKISDNLNLILTNDVFWYCKNAPLSRTTISAPRNNKWKEINFDKINAIIPLITKTASRIGYDLNCNC